MSELRHLPAAPPPPDLPPRQKRKTEDEISKIRRAELKRISKRFITDHEYVVAKEIYERHRGNWPQILRVGAGCEGETDFVTFSSDEVLRVDREFHYQCVLARDRVGRIVSIPLEFDVKCCVVTHNKVGKEERLADIVASGGFPITVKFAVPDNYVFDLGDTSHRADSFGHMALLDIYEETYLVSNPLIDGVLDPHIIIIPLYLEMLISTVVGSEELSPEEWYQYTEDHKMEAAKYDFSSVQGRKAMAIYPEIPDEAKDMGEYSYIQPDNYVILRHKSSLTPSYERIKYSQVYKCNDDENIYDEIVPIVPPRSRTPPPLAYFTKRKSKYEPAVLPRKPSRAGNDVSNLTVAELGESLRLLKLDKYVKKFLKHGIDGAVVADMDESVLKKDFGFKDFEAIKFRKFVENGHIPR